MSWLDFNSRVLALAADRSAPLLERAKFLAIFASNLDEFYMVRVAGLKRRQSMGLGVRSADGLGVREQLERIAARAQELASEHARLFLQEVRPALDERGIRLVLWKDLPPEQQAPLHDYFRVAGLPGADAAGGRPGPPVPVHQRALAQPRGARARPGARASSTSPG